MADQVLKLKDIENFFIQMTCKMLDIDTSKKENLGKVRKTWIQTGTPAWKIDEDIVFMRITPVDDKAARELNIIYSQEDEVNLNKKTGYTRVIKIDWCLYGPNSYDNSDIIRYLIFDFNYMAEFKKKNLFLITDVSMPVRLPELYNGQWWERTDFSASFNESVIRESKTPYLTSTNIITITNR